MSWYLATCTVAGIVLRGMHPLLAPLVLVLAGYPAMAICARGIEWGSSTQALISAMLANPWTRVVDWGFVLTGLWLSYLVARPARARRLDDIQPEAV